MNIGIDLGATSAKIGLVAKNGKIIDRSIIPSNNTEDEIVFINALISEINALAAKNQIDKIQGIGIGAPNGNYLKGTIEFAQNTTWGKDKVINFADIISEKTGVKCLLTNDANAAALGEMRYGIAKGMKNFIEITLGTGLGAGVVVDGKILYGNDGMAGELGHYKIYRHGDIRRCTCGNYGCLEAYCSAIGVANNARNILSSLAVDSSLKNYKPNEITSQIIFNEAVKGDKTSLRLFEMEGKLLGEAFADFSAIFSPQAIILFGGLTKAKEYFYPTLLAHFEKNLLPNQKGKIELLFSSLPEYDAAILGAEALIA